MFALNRGINIDPREITNYSESTQNLLVLSAFKFNNHQCIILKEYKDQKFKKRFYRRIAVQLVATLYKMQKDYVYPFRLKKSDPVVKEKINFLKDKLSSKVIFQDIRRRSLKCPEIILGYEGAEPDLLWGFMDLIVQLRTGRPFLDLDSQEAILENSVKCFGPPSEKFLSKCLNSHLIDPDWKYDPESFNDVLNLKA